MNEQTSLLQSTITEYESTLPTRVRHDPELFMEFLSTHHEWTPHAAESLTRLARDYGAFMLRNALALAVTLDIKDGELNF